MKKLSNKTMSEVQGGCDVNFTFNGSASDFDEMLGGLEDMGSSGSGQLAYITDLYNSGCITINQ